MGEFVCGEEKEEGRGRGRGKKEERGGKRGEEGGENRTEARRIPPSSAHIQTHLGMTWSLK